MVPFLENDENDYKVLLIVNGRVLDQVHASRTDGKKEIEVKFRAVQTEPPDFTGTVAPVPPEFQ